MDSDALLDSENPPDVAGDTGDINVLYLDDDVVDHKLMSLILKRQGTAPRYNLLCVSDVNIARIALQSRRFHFFILDNRLPTSSNFHTSLETIGIVDKSTKIVVVSSEIDSVEFRNFNALLRKPESMPAWINTPRPVRLYRQMLSSNRFR